MEQDILDPDSSDPEGNDHILDLEEKPRKSCEPCDGHGTVEDGTLCPACNGRGTVVADGSDDPPPSGGPGSGPGQ
jgi:RecJ-like exonuclease